MKKREMKIKAGIYFLLSLLLLPAYGSAQNLSARQILEKAIHRKNFVDCSLKVKIEKTRGGITKNISLDLFQRNYPEMTATLVIIQEPESARGISFLSWDYFAPDKPDAKWYYLPAINQYKELNDEQGKKYEDQFGFSMKIFTIDLNSAEHKLLGEEKINGKSCWRIESILKNPDSAEGARILSWINQETFAAEKIQAFDRAGKMIREFQLQQEKKIQNIWQEMSGIYQDFLKGQQIKFQILDAQFNTGLKDELFLSTKMKAHSETRSKPR